MQILDPLHLDHEKHISAEPCLRQFCQLPQMLGAPLGGGVREGADPVAFQCYALHLQEALPPVFHKGEVKPGLPPPALRFQIFNLSQAACTALTMLLFGKTLLEKLTRIQTKYGMLE